MSRENTPRHRRPAWLHVLLISLAESVRTNVAPLVQAMLGVAFLFSLWSDSLWPLATWLLTALAADFDRGWNRPIERPVTPGMIRITRDGQPPIDVPPTPELIEAIVRMNDIVEGRSDD